MKLMIVGSRSISDLDLSRYIPDGVDIIISGGADGVDTLAENYADKNKISKLILRPRYNLYRRRAPIKRNEEMVDAADEVLVIWDGVSKGSNYTAKYAKNKNKKLTLINISEKE